MKKTTTILIIFLSVLTMSSKFFSGCRQKGDEQPILEEASLVKTAVWTGPAYTQIPLYSDPNGAEILYGYKLIAKTGAYLGPNGSVNQISNGMNCQNCHLDAGTKPFGNNFGAVASTYPKYRERSGQKEDISKRINDCFERSLNGKSLPDSGREMKAMVAYINWVGHKIPKGEKPEGSGIMKLTYLNRAADPQEGRLVFVNHCVRCHGEDGQGLASLDGKGYEFPPLWGPNSYNQGAGLFRLSRFAGYVYNNMPNTTNWHKPELTEEQAWDVAAFVNSQSRPQKDLNGDWPDISKKPVDHPFGPYADPFTESQHKYGPFQPIEDWKKEHK